MNLALVIIWVQTSFNPLCMLMWLLIMYLTCGTQLSTSFLLPPPLVVKQRCWARRARADPAAPPHAGGHPFGLGCYVKLCLGT